LFWLRLHPRFFPTTTHSLVMIKDMGSFGINYTKCCESNISATKWLQIKKLWTTKLDNFSDIYNFCVGYFSIWYLSLQLHTHLWCIFGHPNDLKSKKFKLQRCRSHRVVKLWYKVCRYRTSYENCRFKPKTGRDEPNITAVCSYHYQFKRQTGSDGLTYTITACL